MSAGQYKIWPQSVFDRMLPGQNTKKSSVQYHWLFIQYASGEGEEVKGVQT